MDGMDVARVIIVCFLVVLLGIISAGTGLAAELTRVKPSDIEGYSGECIYPSSPATLLGIVSAGTLLIAQIIINLATCCFCCIRRTGQSTLAQAICFYIISKITFLLAMGLLITGVRLNVGNSTSTLSGDYYYCSYIRPGVFAAGAVFAALSSIFGVLYYSFVSSKANDASNAPVTTQGVVVMTQQPRFPSENPGLVRANGYEYDNQGALVMAQPRFPSENPGRVHENAYDKSQSS